MRSFIRERLHKQHETIDYLLQGFTEERLRTRVEPTKWSIHEHIAHIGRYQEVFNQQLRAMLETTTPIFPHYKAEDDPEFSFWCARDISKNLAALYQKRRELTTTLESCTATQLARTGIHPVYGSITIEQWTEFFLLHEAHHLFFVCTVAWRGDVVKASGL